MPFPKLLSMHFDSRHFSKFSLRWVIGQSRELADFAASVNSVRQQLSLRYRWLCLRHPTIPWTLTSWGIRTQGHHHHVDCHPWARARDFLDKCTSRSSHWVDRWSCEPSLTSPHRTCLARIRTTLHLFSSHVELNYRHLKWRSLQHLGESELRLQAQTRFPSMNTVQWEAESS